MSGRANIRSPNSMAKTPGEKKFLERLNDAQLAPGHVSIWARVGATVPDPPLGWLLLDHLSNSSPGIEHKIKEYRELAYSGSPFILLDEAAGTFRTLYTTFTGAITNLAGGTTPIQMRLIIKT